MNSVPCKRNDAFVETSVDDETVLMDLASGAFFSLTGSGARIWELIDGTRDRAAILAALAAEYGSGEEELARDLEAFLAELGEAGLVEG